jgi:hypothetical protein
MRAIGLSSITLATVALTATDVRSANNNWCATYTRPANENCTFATFEQCHAQVWGLADGVGPIRSPTRRSGPVGPGPIDRASLAAAVSAAARRQGRRIRSRRRRKLSRDARRPISDVMRVLGCILNF